MTTYLIDGDTLTDIANSIRGKTGGSSPIAVPNMSTAIDNIPSGGTPVINPLPVTANGIYTAPSGVDGYSPVTVNVPDPDDDVVFFDYDGTVLYSYTKSDFLALSSMPSLPDHTSDNLTADGWNWSLENAQTYVTTYGGLDIGAMYYSNINDTTILIELEEGRLSPYICLAPNGTVTIDWGDNTTSDTMTGTSIADFQRLLHGYASAGTYTITISISEGTTYEIGYSDYNHILMKSSSGNISDDTQKIYQSAIKEVNIGEGVTYIRDRQFEGMYNLEKVTFCQNCYATLDTRMFKDCYSLKTVAMHSGITAMEGSVFEYCKNLNYITISPNLTMNNSSNFYGSGLKRVSIGYNVVLHNSTFYNCYALERIHIDNFYRSEMLKNCNAIKKLIMSKYSDTDQIGDSYCYPCNSLLYVKIPSGVTTVRYRAFRECGSLETVVLPSTITIIGDQSFYNCYNLKNINLEDTATTSINPDAFVSCRSLRSIELPSTLTTINGSAFTGCIALTSITIPENVTTIGANAFNNCKGLAKIIFEGTTPPTVSNSNAWTNIPSDCVIYVPSGTLNAYTSANNYPSSSTYTYVEY